MGSYWGFVKGFDTTKGNWNRTFHEITELLYTHEVVRAQLILAVENETLEFLGFTDLLWGQQVFSVKGPEYFRLLYKTNCSDVQAAICDKPVSMNVFQ